MAVQSKMKVLVVEDEAEVRETLSEIIKESGAEAHLASSGRAALSAIESQSFDLILLDIKLPGVSGIELCKKIREMLIKTPIVIVSGTDTDRNVEMARIYGVMQFISKPFNVEQIMKVLKRAQDLIEKSK